MTTDEIQILFREFSSHFEWDREAEVWNTQGKIFRDFWNEKILNGQASLTAADTDPIIRLLDTKARGHLAADLVVARTGIYQSMWERVFNDLKTKKDIQDTMQQSFIEFNDDKLIKLVDQLWLENKNNKNGLTGKNANVLNTILFINRPDYFLNMVSLSHRSQVLRSFGLGDPQEFRTYGEEIILSNRMIIDGFRKKYGIATTPRALTEFLYAPHDYFEKPLRTYWQEPDEAKSNSSVKFATTPRSDVPSTTRGAESLEIQEVIKEQKPKSVDPVPRIRMLKAAGTPPISVTRNDRVLEAITIMLQHDYSQLPVMQSPRDVDVALISWKSIGEAAKVHNKECSLVSECMDRDVEILRDDTPLLKALQSIAEKDVVLVRNPSKGIVGLVTTTDIALEYNSLAEPFLLIREIENQLRLLIAKAGYSLELLCSVRDPNDTGRKIEQISDLSFGEYLRLLESPENWQYIGFNLDRKTILSRLDSVRKIRNEVMHFDPEPLSPEKLQTLRGTAQFMRSLELWNIE
jgi:predicted transcriptional regulator